MFSWNALHESNLPILVYIVLSLPQLSIGFFSSSPSQNFLNLDVSHVVLGQLKPGFIPVLHSVFLIANLFLLQLHRLFQGDLELEGLEAKAKASGASQLVVKDLKEEFVRDFIYPCLRAGAVYERKYLLGTSMARPVIAKVASTSCQASPSHCFSSAFLSLELYTCCHMYVSQPRLVNIVRFPTGKTLCRFT